MKELIIRPWGALAVLAVGLLVGYLLDLGLGWFGLVGFVAWAVGTAVVAVEVDDSHEPGAKVRGYRGRQQKAKGGAA